MTGPHDTPRTDERAGLSEVLAAHEYALGMRRGSICLCGFVPDVDPGSVTTQQDYHREHIAGLIADRLAAAVARAEAAEARVAAVEALCQKWERLIGTGIPPSRQPATDLRAALTGDHLPERDEATEYVVPFRRGDRLRVVDKGGSLLFKFPWEVGDFVTVRVCYPDTVDLVEDDGMVHWKTSLFQAAPERGEGRA